MRIGCIFDLDGVIVDTAKYHYLAWRRLANELGFDFTEKENEQLKGVSRVESLNQILRWGRIDKSLPEKEKLMQWKNDWYLEYIQRMTPDEILDGVIVFLSDLRDRNIPMAIGSASKNANLILEKIGLTDWFHVVIDGHATSKSKPDPDVFLLGARGIGHLPNRCIVFEDAEKGIEAALNGGFYTVGIGSPEHLHHAHWVIPNFTVTDIQEICFMLKISVDD